MHTDEKSSLKRVLGLSLFCLAVAVAVVGCEKQEEKVLDLKTPGVDVEVDKTENGLKVNVKKNAEEN